MILTETVALGAFLYRFSLDRQIIDLHDEIEQKQAIVNLLKTNEEKYRSLQNRLANASSLSKTAFQTTRVFTDIVSLAPNDLILNNLTLSQNTIKIDASARSVASLTTFVKQLKGYPNIRAVSLDRVENKTLSATIAVSITADLK